VTIEKVLGHGQFYRNAHFGADTINRGAVLLECEWSGGTFESGVMLGGIFRSGEVLGGDFSGVVFWSGRWVDGNWLGGFDHTGRYRPRTDSPCVPSR
jgi:hypothetical protein